MNTEFELLRGLYSDRRRSVLSADLQNRYGWTDAEWQRSIEHYWMFLSLVPGGPKHALVPTETIDRVWEADILLDTAHYIQVCRQLCGRVIHHRGEIVLQKMSADYERADAFSRTWELMQMQYGQQMHLHMQEIVSMGLNPAACGVLIDYQRD